MRWPPGLVLLTATIAAAGCAARELGEDRVDAGAEDATAPRDGDSGSATITVEASAPFDASAMVDAAADAPPDASDEGHALDTGAAHADGAATDAAQTGDAADAGDAGPAGIDCTTDADHPVQLACTGLYGDWATRTIAPDVRAYAPAYTLWSDGADKSRWIALPPGTRIDTSAMDEWTFPVGTKLWKEFRLSGRPVETRLMWKRGAGDWLRTTYVWSADGSSATEVTAGIRDAGGGYEIPAQPVCTTCHQGRIDGVLGFEAVGLAAPGATGLTLAELVAENLVTSPPAAPLVVPGDATASAALAWLHANCGTACHNRSPSALAGATGLFMRLEVAQLGSVQATDTWTTAVGRPSGFQPAPDAGLLRIAPGSTAESAVYFRDSFRDDQGQGYQMPPVDTHVVPAAGVALVAAWIQSMQ